MKNKTDKKIEKTKKLRETIHKAEKELRQLQGEFTNDHLVATEHCDICLAEKGWLHLFEECKKYLNET
jgi:hypothetical protein